MSFVKSTFLWVMGASVALAIVPMTWAQEEVQVEVVLAPIWDENITQWSSDITEMALQYQLDPDLVAAVVWSESRGQALGVSYAGAVGLMGIMPEGPGFEYRPNSTALLDPRTNINWGCAILADIMNQSGGDVHASLAAYNGGWGLVGHNVPQAYADQVLNNYGRAIASRNGIDPDEATRWTVAIKVRRGYISAESFLFNGESITQDTPTYGEHVIYSDADDYVLAYAVPIGWRD